MNILKLTSLSLLLLTGPVLRAEPPAVSPPNATDPLAEALPILQTKYVDFKALQFKEGDHLSDLIARSGGGLTLDPSPQARIQPSTDLIVSALLPGNVAYFSLPTFCMDHGFPPILAQISQWTQQGVTGMIFDVRSNKDDNDYQGAADIANLVVPSGTTVFTIKEAGGNTHICSTREATQTFLGPVIVLTNRQTTGAGEALADYLRQYRGAIVLGQTTRGQTAVLSWTPLSSGQVLWFPTARVSLPNGIDLWNQPVVPDIALTVDDRAEKGALVLIKDNHILDVIEESAERHRMSEASLVRGQDPEWDDYLASIERKPVLLSLPIIHDVVLIRALDSLKAIRLSQSPLPAQARADASPPASASLQ